MITILIYRTLPMLFFHDEQVRAELPQNTIGDDSRVPPGLSGFFFFLSEENLIKLMEKNCAIQSNIVVCSECPVKDLFKNLTGILPISPEDVLA